jgi:NitT/TauT family transport system permease protein
MVDYFKTLKFKTIFDHAIVTICRTLLSYLISVGFALAIAIAANYKKADHYINPVISILKTIPTISIMIIALIWLGRNESVLLISFLVVFPILYEMFYHHIKHIDKNLLEVCVVYQFSYTMRVKYLYFYNVLESFFISLKQTFGLSFKIMVMSEVIGQTSKGIGMKIYNEKVNLNMAGVFAWTIILVIIVLLIDFLIEKCSKRVLKWR